MILSPNRSGRGGKTVRLIVVHTAEGARTVESLGAFFSRSTAQASSHAGIDDKRVETYVPYDQMAWTVRSGNAISDNVELCAFAAWTRDQWLNEHHRMLELTAGWIAERCRARNVPIRKLSPSELAAGQAGVIGHIDWTLGMKEGSHTDPGPGFPWDVVIQMANGAVTPIPQQEDDMTDQDRAMLTAVYQQLSGSPKFGEWPGWQTWGGGTEEHLTLVDLARRNNVEVRQAWLAVQELLEKVDLLTKKLDA
ncbi:MAG: N-acetylmuramoyl-L-alanine amidase [Pseudonocardiales bacterium]|nr:N-acetylmuramoyl-L-alanine amidase [Pseudonocardiales bacterium]